MCLIAAGDQNLTIAKFRSAKPVIDLPDVLVWRFCARSNQLCGFHHAQGFRITRSDLQVWQRGTEPMSPSISSLKTPIIHILRWSA